MEFSEFRYPWFCILAQAMAMAWVCRTNETNETRRKEQRGAAKRRNEKGRRKGECQKEKSERGSKE